MRSVGIDVGRFTIKVVELTAAANRGYQFTGAKIYPLDQKDDNNEIQILQILKQIKKDFDTDNAKVTTSMRQNYVSMRKVFFPFKERQKILKSLAFEIEDDIPYSIDKSIFDAKILSVTNNASQVMAMACPIHEVEETLAMFGKAGIDPDILSPEFSALSNLYQPKWYLSPADVEKQDGPAPENEHERLVVHIGHGRTFAGIVRGSQLLWGRGLIWGVELIARDIAKTFQVPFTEALKMMPSKAFLLMMTDNATQDQKKMSDTIAKALTPLIESLRLTIILANTEFEMKVSQVELFGGASEIKNLGSFLTQALELPTNLHNPLENYPVEKVKALLPHKQTCLMAFGLAIEGLKRPASPAVNFRQNDFAKKNHSFEKFWDKWGFTTKMLAVAWACFLMAGIVRNSIATDLEELSYDLLTSQAKKVAGIRKYSGSKARKYIKKQKQKVELVKLYDNVADIIAPAAILNQLSSTLPPNDKAQKYDIRHLSISNEILMLHGFADGKKIISKIEKNLKVMTSTGKVEKIKSIIPKENGRTSFSYKFKIKRKN